MTDAPAPRPAELYGELLHEVQMRRLFADGKHFVDMEPKHDPAEIMRRYGALSAAYDKALLDFVIDNFDPPATPAALPLPAGSLSDHIEAMWDRLGRPPAVGSAYSSALALPSPFLAPGGRFREFYYWDSYFSMLGLVHDGRGDLAEALVDNCTALIERFGYVPNGSRTYYLGRSHPPVYYLMVELSGARDAETRRRRLAAMQMEHAFWMQGAATLAAGEAAIRAVRLADGSILNRYWADEDGPREEAYAEDSHTAKSSGRDPAAVYRDLRAAAESGWDFSSRWFGPQGRLGSTRTTAIAPVDLNSLLFGLEGAIARLARELGDTAARARFAVQARARREALRRHCWNTRRRRFGDLDLTAGGLTPSINAAALFPLFTGAATSRQARAVAELTAAQLLGPGGLRTTVVESGEQWDCPNGWAPLQWIAVSGLLRYGHAELARTIAERWLATVERDFAETGMVFEKYDVEQARRAGGGEYPVQDGFGWTNGVLRTLSAAIG